MGDPIDARHLLDYSDNARETVGQHLLGELAAYPDVLAVVTGYFDPGVWRTLGPALQQTRRFRLLLGKDYELTQRVPRGAIEADIQRQIQAVLREDLEAPPLPSEAEADAIAGWLALLDRADSVVDVRVWPEGFLHAKAYLLEASVGVGSANFTRAGLAVNKELVLWRQDRSVVRQLHEWFESFWAQAAPYKGELRRILAESRFGTTRWTPFQVLIRTLADRYGLDRPESLDTVHFSLKWFQEEAVFRLIRLLRGPAGGALLADAVGLGKTFMALGVIHHFLYQTREQRRGRRGRPVVVLVPASLRPMWERQLREAGMDWACDVVSLQSLTHDFDPTPYTQADLVVIDEAHRLRGGRAWFQSALRLIREGVPDKRVLLLSATPVHTSLRDLTQLLRLITKNRRNVWAPEIPDFDQYLKRVERRETDPFPILDRAVVRRSRSDILRAWEERRAAGASVWDEAPHLPKRHVQHITYQYVTGRPSDFFGEFADVVEHLTLAPYRLDHYLVDPDAHARDDAGVAGLFMAGLLKRFESSLRAVRTSLTRLERFLMWAEAALRGYPPQVLNWRNAQFQAALRAEVDGDDEQDAPEADWTPYAVVLEHPERYDLTRAADDMAADIRAIQELMERLPAETHDGKVATLIMQLVDAVSRHQRVLVFTQYRDTAQHLADQLSRDTRLARRVVEIDGSTAPAERQRACQWFDPDGPLDEDNAPMILVATDVLAEGHNLQRAQAVINFDLHWNPQVAVQRAGRIDRLNSPHKEVFIRSFVPEEGLDAHLGLVQRLNARFELIHSLGLGDEPITEFVGDFQAFTFEQLRRLYRDDDTVLDEIEAAWGMGSTDFMRQPLEAYLRRVTEDEVRKIPLGVQSAKWALPDWQGGPAVFLAFALDEGDRHETHWRLYLVSGGPPETDDVKIFRAIVAQEAETPAEWPTREGTTALIDWPLLRRAAQDVADAINRRRATASYTSGASAISQRWRRRLLDLVEAADLLGDSEALALLDRLEEVRIEDYDGLAGYRAWQDAVRAAQKAEEACERVAYLRAAVQSGLELFGHPESHRSLWAEIRPDDLRLVAWEYVVPRPQGARGAQDRWT